MRISTDVLQTLNENSIDVSSAWLWVDADSYDGSYRQVLDQPISLESTTLDFLRWKVPTITLTIRVSSNPNSVVLFNGIANLIDDSQASAAGNHNDLANIYGEYPYWHLSDVAHTLINAQAALTGTGALLLTSGVPSIIGIGVANGLCGLGADSRVAWANLPASLSGAVHYAGTWDASTNTPTLPDPTTNNGAYYIVSVAGSYSGIIFAVGDACISNGTDYEKIDNTQLVTSVFGRVGAIAAAATDYSAYYPRLDNTYTDPPWIGSLAWTKISGKPSTLADYGIASTDTLFDTKYLGINANAASATKLATARTIAMSGDGTWRVYFDGSANATGELTLATLLAAGSATAQSRVPTLTWDAKGRLTAAGSAAISIPHTQINDWAATLGGYDLISNTTFSVPVTGDGIITLATGPRIEGTYDIRWEASSRVEHLQIVVSTTQFGANFLAINIYKTYGAASTFQRISIYQNSDASIKYLCLTIGNRNGGTNSVSVKYFGAYGTAAGGTYTGTEAAYLIPALNQYQNTGSINAPTIYESNVALSSKYLGISASIPHTQINDWSTATSGFQTSLGFTPVQQGGGTAQGGNKIYIGWGTNGVLRLQVDTTNFGSTWPININGTASFASSVAWTNVTGRPTALSSFTNDSGYLTANQSISLTGAVSGSGTTSIATSFANTHLAGIDQDLTTTSSPMFAGLYTTGTYGSCGVFAGNADNAGYTAYNLKIKSWWGIGFESYDGVTRILMDTRTGGISTLGGINASGLITANGGITGNLTGHASLDLPLTGGTMTAGAKILTLQDMTISTGANGNCSNAPFVAQRYTSDSTTTTHASIGFHNRGVNAAALFYHAGYSNFWFNDHTGGLYQLWSSKDFASQSITNWTTAYNWGNHASAGYLLSSNLTWANIASKPTGMDNRGAARLYRGDAADGYWLSHSWSNLCTPYFGSNSWYLTASNSGGDSQGGIHTVLVDYAGLSVNSLQLGGIAASSYLLSSTAASTYLPFSTITPFSVGSVSVNNYWGKLATLTITAQYGSASAVVRVADSGGDTSTLNFAATIKVNIKQQSAMTNGLEYMACDLESSVGINPADVRLIKTVDTSSTKTCELWIQWRQQYSNIKCFGENNGAATFASSTLVSAPTTALSYVTAGSNSNFVNILTASTAIYSKYGTIDGQYFSTNYDFAGFGHKSCTTAGNYCLIQNASGITYLNGSTDLHLQINNAGVMDFTSTLVSIAKPLTVSGLITANGGISGNLTGHASLDIPLTGSVAVTGSIQTTQGLYAASGMVGMYSMYDNIFTIGNNAHNIQVNNTTGETNFIGLTSVGMQGSLTVSGTFTPAVNLQSSNYTITLADQGKMVISIYTINLPSLTDHDAGFWCLVNWHVGGSGSVFGPTTSGTVWNLRGQVITVRTSTPFTGVVSWDGYTWYAG